MPLTFRCDLTADEVRRLFAYDREAGVLFRLVGKGRGRRISNEMKQPGKYARVRVGRGVYAVHRVMWLHATGEWPAEVIDHINGDPTDNRLCNLRAVSQVVNMQNQRRAMTTSKTGLLGAISYEGMFLAQITVDGRIRHLGKFDTPEAAHNAYLQAKRSLHQGCTI